MSQVPSVGINSTVCPRSTDPFYVVRYYFGSLLLGHTVGEDAVLQALPGRDDWTPLQTHETGTGWPIYCVYKSINIGHNI